MSNLNSGTRAARRTAHFLMTFRQFINLRCPAHSRPRNLHLTPGTASSHKHHAISSLVQSYRNYRSRQRPASIPSSLFCSQEYTSAAATSAQLPLFYNPPLTHNTNNASPDDAPAPKERVLLLMSGGVDSSMCAYILHNQGYDVTGLYMHNWNHDEETQDEVESESRSLRQQPSGSEHDTLYLTESTPPSNPTTSPAMTITSLSTRSPRTARTRPKVCTSDRDWADVQAVCAQIGIPARRLDFSRQYWNQVFEVMLAEYERGRTPNPDITCNREIKFGELIEWCHRNGGLGKDRHRHLCDQDKSQDRGRTSNKDANANNLSAQDTNPMTMLQGWDYLATGHYARVERDSLTGQAKLLRALDSNKDQTYYLSTLSEEVLRHVLFPLAQYDKPTIKKMALTTGAAQLKNAAVKKESMGICFVGQRKRFGEFLEEYLETRRGPVRVNGLEGPIIGEHKGLVRYTVGQASGVTHGCQKWVVLRTDLPSNTLIVVEGTQNPRLFSPGLIAESWHWIAGQPPQRLLQSTVGESDSPSSDEYPFTAQIRHRQAPQPCKIEPILDTAGRVSDAVSAQLFRVHFKDLQRAIAPGQQIVLYDQDECLGGAVIQSGLPSPFDSLKQ